MGKFTLWTIFIWLVSYYFHPMLPTLEGLMIRMINSNRLGVMSAIINLRNDDFRS